MEQLEKLLSSQHKKEDMEPIDESHLLRFGQLQGDYLIDFSMLTQEGELPHQHKNKPVVYTVDTCKQIGKIQGVGYVHYNSELFQTE